MLPAGYTGKAVVISTGELVDVAPGEGDQVSWCVMVGGVVRSGTLPANDLDVPDHVRRTFPTWPPPG
jgi:hypothetical protein